MSIRRLFTNGRLALAFSLSTICFGMYSIQTQAANPAIPSSTISALDATQAGFRAVQKEVSPAVVTIFSTQEVTPPAGMNPFDLFGLPRQPQTRKVSGSGVIIRSEGIVLTNSHVVQDATSVTVQLPGSDTKLPAKVVQSDQKTDLAIVRINENGNYPTATLGDAANVQVGDWAIAFGSPYGLPSTMTVGVISAIGRKLDGPEGKFDYYNLLQTDASINHGNSGGPLVNIRGEVVGINFMIFSPGEDSGSIGIGFAIPINEYTRKVIDSLVAGHAYERGLIGVQISAMDAAKRQQFGVPEGGVFVQNVVPGKAGEKAGIQDEDIIVEFNGVKVTEPDQFVNMVQQTPPGTKVPVKIIRDKKPLTLTVTLTSDNPGKTASADGALTPKKVGLTVETLTPEISRNTGLPQVKGVVVTQVAPGSPAEEARLTPGTIIMRVGDTAVTTDEEFWTALSKAMAASKFGVVMRVRQGNTAQTITMPNIPAEEEKDK